VTWCRSMDSRVSRSPRFRRASTSGRVIRARLNGDTGAAPLEVLRQGQHGDDRPHAWVAASGKMNFVGFPAFVMWAFIHVLYLIGWGNRLGTLYTWARALWFTHNRAHRIITLDQACDEMKHERPTGRVVRSAEPRVTSADD
jgi:NADH dehydrogenase